MSGVTRPNTLVGAISAPHFFLRENYGQVRTDCKFEHVESVFALMHQAEQVERSDAEILGKHAHQ